MCHITTPAPAASTSTVPCRVDTWNAVRCCSVPHTGTTEFSLSSSTLVCEPISCGPWPDADEAIAAAAASVDPAAEEAYLQAAGVTSRPIVPIQNGDVVQSVAEVAGFGQVRAYVLRASPCLAPCAATCAWPVSFVHRSHSRLCVCAAQGQRMVKPGCSNTV